MGTTINNQCNARIGVFKWKIMRVYVLHTCTWWWVAPCTWPYQQSSRSVACLYCDGGDRALLSTACSSPRSATQWIATQRMVRAAQGTQRNAWHTQRKTLVLLSTHSSRITLLQFHYWQVWCIAQYNTDTAPRPYSILLFTNYTVTFPCSRSLFAHNSSPSLIDERTAMHPFLCRLVQGLFLENECTTTHSPHCW